MLDKKSEILTRLHRRIRSESFALVAEFQITTECSTDTDWMNSHKSVRSFEKKLIVDHKVKANKYKGRIPKTSKVMANILPINKREVAV